MAVKKCYCEKQFQDTPADRKRHVQGIQQQQAKARWYDSFKQQQIPPVPNRSLCFHFVNTGFCRYGDSCKYLHPIPNNNLQQPPVLTTPSPSPPPGNVVGVSLDNLPPLLQPPPEGIVSPWISRFEWFKQMFGVVLGMRGIVKELTRISMDWL
ncbi:Zinc finger CCCH domain-containing protein 3 isoform A [Glycine soja]|uniref:Zinc finger CCCH domain-containing protein 3 isoform A n=1 Tax=Glycine soja TaxID=3848 RepID=A0A445F2Q6_GLYSO|nr:Zinc finger CCCH domain-containing protein 3 isoform A [Glycine soja]